VRIGNLYDRIRETAVLGRSGPDLSVGLCRVDARCCCESAVDCPSNLVLGCECPAERCHHGSGIVPALQKARQDNRLANQLDSHHHAEYDSVRLVELVVVVTRFKRTCFEVLALHFDIIIPRPWNEFEVDVVDLNQCFAACWNR
ncbi:MAG: hypothetical protein JWM11_5745, partial [Planctomycetaceae bacterium]|nr:hypothetical protein [Planctomycetaceae bacterium]